MRYGTKPHTARLTLAARVLCMLALVGALIVVPGCIGQNAQGSGSEPAATSSGTYTSSASIDADGYYYSVEDVTLYLETYGTLPPNYITKSEASDLGWRGGSVERYRDGAAIGGDVFGNREGSLPRANGTYRECDIDTDGKSSRGAKRLIYTDDGDPSDGCGPYYYTDDHYESFTEVEVRGGEVVFL